MAETRELSQSTEPYQVAYSAIMDGHGKRFTVHAVGLNKTRGYQTFFQIDPILILPPQIDFVNIPPSGIALQQVENFHVQLTMVAASVAGQPQWTVDVHDTKGRHTVRIQGAEVPTINFPAAEN